MTTQRQRMLVNMILDRSGSMAGLEKDVLGHYNSYIKTLKTLPVDVRVSLIIFDTEYTEVYINQNPSDVPKLTDKIYFARGGTALLDAVGRTIRATERLWEKPDKVVFVINTDGYENSSKEFSKKQIKELVEKHEKADDWQFVFIGAGIDAFAEAYGLGVRTWNTASFGNTSAGYDLSYRSLTNSTHNYATTVSAGNLNATFNLQEGLKEAEEELKTKPKRTRKKVDSGTSSG